MVKIGWMYIYKEKKGEEKLAFVKAIKMIGFSKADELPNDNSSPFSMADSFNELPASEVEILHYEIWNPGYLEKHPDSSSDFMHSAKITHASAQQQTVKGELNG